MWSWWKSNQNCSVKKNTFKIVQWPTILYELQGKLKWTSELYQVGDWQLGQVFNSLSIFSSSQVVIVYNGNRAATKAERLWHLHFHYWLLILWSHRKSACSNKLFRCWSTLEYKNLSCGSAESTEMKSLNMLDMFSFCWKDALGQWDHFFPSRIHLKSQDDLEVPINYFVGMTNQLGSFLDQVNSTRHCATPGCDAKKH